MIKPGKRTALLTGVVAAGVLATPAFAFAAPAHTRVVGHTYVDENTLGTNTLAGFDRHADGSLTPIPGSPFAIGGAGSGDPLASQGALQAAGDGKFLLAVDAGSNQVSVLRLNGAGVPSPIGAPVSSGGSRPVSIAVSSRGLVYVANVGVSGSNYTGFRLTPQGALHPIENSTVDVPDGSGVGDALFNATGDRLIGTRDNTSLLDSFVVRPDGRLTAAAGSPFPAQAPGPIGAEFRPTDPAQLFVTNAHAGPGNGSVSAFTDGRNGSLTSIGASPFPDGQTAPCWVETSHDGRYLFAVNTGSTTISSYSIHRDGSLVLLGTTPFHNAAGSIDARLSPDGRFLSVTGRDSHVVSTFAVSGGNLTELANSPVPLPADGAPSGLVVL